MLERVHVEAAVGEHARHLLPLPGIAGAVAGDPDQGAVDTLFRPRSPGMKYKHYAPDADVILIEGSEERFRMRARELGLEAMKEGKRAAIIDYGDDPNRAAHRFFADLRELDRQGYDLILVRSMEQKGKGFSVMNRMLKSAGYDVE
jgi:L-threonylcarbamoyladenylate synthase